MWPEGEHDEDFWSRLWAELTDPRIQTVSWDIETHRSGPLSDEEIHRAAPLMLAVSPAHPDTMVMAIKASLGLERDVTREDAFDAIHRWNTNFGADPEPEGGRIGDIERTSASFWKAEPPAPNNAEHSSESGPKSGPTEDHSG